jgi:hypothetical protein
MKGISDYLDKLDRIKETKLRVREVETRIDAFSKLEHIDTIQKVLMPLVSRTADKIGEFMKQIDGI